jgi:nucleotide-binding universal stress UspA family protein
MTTASGAPVVAVGVDSSPASILALRWAAKYAADNGARLRAAGSVSMHCVTHAACPVVVVRSGQ